MTKPPMTLEEAVRYLRDRSRVGGKDITTVTMHPNVYKILTGSDAGDMQHVATVDGIDVYLDSFERPYEMHGYTQETIDTLREMRFVNKEVSGGYKA